MMIPQQDDAADAHAREVNAYVVRITAPQLGPSLSDVLITTLRMFASRFPGYRDAHLVDEIDGFCFCIHFSDAEAGRSCLAALQTMPSLKDGYNAVTSGPVWN